MLNVTLVTVGSLKEPYLRDAVSEYEKRLGAFCKLHTVNLKEAKLSDDPTPGEIASALEKEGVEILSSIPPRSYKIALCVEGKQLSSENLAKKLETVGTEGGSVTLIIGSSFGLSEKVKEASDFRLSVSELTFPHQLMRVILLETLYRSLSILKGTKYHK